MNKLILNIYEGPILHKFAKQFFVLLLIASGYYLSAKAGLFFVSPVEKISAFWPPSGFALSVLLISNRKFWLKIIFVIFISNLLANYTSGNSISISSGFALINSLEPLLIAFFITFKSDNHISIYNIKFVLKLLSITPAIILFTAFGGSLVTFLGFKAPFWSSYFQWFLSDTFGVFIITPFLLNIFELKNEFTEYNKLKFIELIFITLIIIILSFLIFSTDKNMIKILRPYILIPLFFIIALRHNMITTTSTLLIFSCIAVWGTVNRVGSFGQTTNSMKDALLHVQIFLGFTIISTIIVSVFSSERKRLLKTIKQSLKEKKWLLKEVHHRVKNNMSMIISLLSLQSESTINVEAKKILIDTENRIRTIALVQKQLYLDEDCQTMEIGTYIKDLADSILFSFDGSERIKIEFNLEKIYIDIDKLIPCGLILNEAITNSLKYAFDDTENPSITISFSQQENNEIIFLIKDNGAGLPDDFDISISGGLGLKLITKLSEQIDGVSNIENDNGLKIIIQFSDNTV